MAYDSRSLDDYVDVAQRIADFRAQYPDGCLQPADPAHPWEQAVVNGIGKDGKPFAATMITYVAAAYRTPDDPRPGIGSAWEVFPGRTPYTLGSELQNAETSAWGRAIIAVLASDSKSGVASRQEVRNRRAEREDGLPSNADGSLSRSQTTDEEKDASGNMTSAQWAEHTALQKGADGKLPPAEKAKVEHAATVPPDDPFYDPPAADQVPAEDRHGTATAEQIRDINIRLTSQGLTQREGKLALLTEELGRPVKSSKDLSFSEAARVLRSLPVRQKEAVS